MIMLSVCLCVYMDHPVVHRGLKKRKPLIRAVFCFLLFLVFIELPSPAPLPPIPFPPSFPPFLTPFSPFSPPFSHLPGGALSTWNQPFEVMRIEVRTYVRPTVTSAVVTTVMIKIAKVKMHLFFLSFMSSYSFYPSYSFYFSYSSHPIYPFSLFYTHFSHTIFTL